MKISDNFIQVCIQDRLEEAVRYGVTRAWKHSNDKPPSDNQVDIICENVTSALFDIFDFISPGENEND